MAGPFDSADDKGALEALEREIQGGRGTDPDDLPAELELGVPLDAKPDDDDDPADTPQTRAEKKRARRPLIAELEAVREEARQARAEADRAREENRAVLARFEQQARGNEQSPIDKEIEGLYDDQERLVGDYNRRVQQYQAAQQQMPDSEASEWRKRAKDLEIKKTRALARSAVQSVTPQDITQQQLKSEYPEVYGNQAALMFATGEFMKLRSRGEPDSIATTRKAMEVARDEFGLSGRKRVDPDDARRYRSAPRGGNGSSTKEPTRLTWSKDLQKIADAAYSHEPDPRKRAQMWANDNGKEYLAATRSRA